MVEGTLCYCAIVYVVNNGNCIKDDFTTIGVTSSILASELPCFPLQMHILFVYGGIYSVQFLLFGTIICTLLYILLYFFEGCFFVHCLLLRNKVFPKQNEQSMYIHSSISNKDSSVFLIMALVSILQVVKNQFLLMCGMFQNQHLIS